jgi:hypothetical protein
MVGKLYYDLNEHEKAMYYWSICHDIDRERYEGIYELITHFRKIGNSFLAYKYYNMIEKDAFINAGGIANWRCTVCAQNTCE